MVPLLVLLAAPDLATSFAKVGPNPAAPARTPGTTRAIVLIHGLGLHPFSADKVVKPRLRAWQHASSPLVKALAKGADVFAFAYGQTVPAHRVHEEAGLARYVKKLKADGYAEIVLVGHSAGGLIARHLAEDEPDCGVTRVVQVCAPNLGSGWAVSKAVRDVQSAFLASLSKKGREKVLAERAGKKLPANLEFVCLVGSCRLDGDGVVGLASQWSDDLQKQGVPALVVGCGHKDVLTTAKGIEAIVKAVGEPAQRWDEKKVAAFRKAT
ncbi:MAG: alpha/beta hydrolase, partial [Gemmataceae bacterium]|nr:alpha/beta hydrolase [Gemmataceae bacterium]